MLNNQNTEDYSEEEGLIAWRLEPIHPEPEFRMLCKPANFQKTTKPKSLVMKFLGHFKKAFVMDL